MKKSLIRVFIVCLLTGCITQKLMGQALGVGLLTQNITPVTPQTWNFITYGGKPFDLHTGTVGVTIPIYTYEDRDFTLPISLSYASNGFRPNAQADIVGYDWHLNVGGIITREKRGLPDEYKHGIGSDYQYGFYEYHKLNSDLTPYETGQRTQNDKVTLWKKGDTGKYELEPDVFRFNFMGYRGAFQMGEKQKVYVYDTNFPCGELIVEIKVETVKEYNNNNRYFSFILTTGDGMKYYFGQNKYSIDCVKSFNSGTDTGIFDDDGYHINLNNNTVCDPDAEATTWHLDKIVAPNGREIIFNYSHSDRNIITYYTQKFCTSYKSNGEIVSSMRPMVGRYYTSSAILGSIVSGNWRAIFRYEKRDGIYKKEKSRNNGDFIVSSDILRSINIYNIKDSGRDTLKTCILNYCGGQKMLLQDVDISGEGTYTMNYYNEDKINIIPAINTFEIDHWGYWNNNSSITAENFLPHINTQLSGSINPLESNPDVELPGERNSNYQATMWGMLTDIKYPTGGSSHFEYESHDYGKAVKHCPTLNTSLDDYAPILVEESGIAGGVRIKSIEDFDESSQSVSKKTYIYKVLDISSGILLKYPRYRVVLRGVNRNNPADFSDLAYVIRDDFNVYKYEKSNVEYSCVLEKYDDGSYTEYKFNSYDNVPDGTVYDKYNEFQPMPPFYSEQISPDNVNGTHNLLKTPTSFNSERGKLLSKVKYDNTANIINGVQYFYNNSTTFVESPMYIPYISCYKRKDKIDNFTLDSVVYYKNNMIFKKVGYRYNAAKQLSRQIEYNSNGSKITTFYDYVKDKQDYNTAEEKMIERNIIKYPLQEYKILRFDHIPDNYVVDYNRVKYSVVNNLVLPKEVYKAYLDELWSRDVEELSTYKDLTLSAYDQYGNVTEVKDKLNRYTCYIWSSNGLYLLAKIVNASLSTVNTLLANAPESQDVVKLSSDKETTLRNNLPNAMITTYEYKPYVGITSITDPNGCKITYEYNSTGKLCAEYDHEGNIIRKYDYSTDK